MNNLRKITGYANITALILYIFGRLMAMPVLCWIGLVLMTLSCIYTIIHWKENEKLTNYIAVAFLVLVGLGLLGI